MFNSIVLKTQISIKKETLCSNKNVSKTYKGKRGADTKALVDVSLKFEDTGLVFILGKSGCGKSTLMNVMGGLDKADFVSLRIRTSKLCAAITIY